MRDSAGVAIAESGRPAWSGGEGWRVDPEPALDIGVAEGDSAYQLYQVRDAATLADGTVVITETTRLRLYDPAGRHVRDIGRPGDGPGEFQWALDVTVLAGDTLLVHDGRSRRITRVTGAGDLVDVTTLRPGELRAGTVFGVLDGRPVGWAIARTEGDAQGFRRDTTVFLAYGWDGAVVAELTRGVGLERIEKTTRVGNTFRVLQRTVSFGRDVQYAIGPAHLWVGQNDGWEIEAYGPDGTLERIVRRPGDPPRPIGAAEVDRYVEWTLEGTLARTDGRPTPPGELEEGIREGPFPPTAPVFRALRVDPDGNLWAEDFRFPWEEGPPTWSVFDAEGRLLGAVELPPGLVVTEIGRGHVLGRWRDELDVEHVRLHRLERGGPPG